MMVPGGATRMLLASTSKPASKAFNRNATSNLSPLTRMAHRWACSIPEPNPNGHALFRSVRRDPLLGRRATPHSPLNQKRFGSSQTPPASPSPGPSPSKAKLSAAELNSELVRRQKLAYKKRNQSLLMYSAATIILGVGVTYAAVPLYRAFCSATGFGGTPMTDPARFEPSRLIPSYLDPSTNSPAKRIRVTFNADSSDAIPWSFSPQQKEIYVLPGETALAFYTAKNRSDKDIIGIATYNVAPDRIAPYFAKVECFCFEEQKLLAGEEVDLPVFFFIDSDVLDDPSVKDVQDVVLSYTFFSARRNAINGQLEPDTDLSQYTVGKDL
ncbi:hypothetical protein IE53DRAFT_324803 [Violaceomyces palustris]|uniref:Uncharacterized protein n=1 Tax=Violaceomyces palustris TaxID=1673888 RepID=A0ACD0P5X6_9BASI|nr:hypothetical protein IE53DRAFT_324803 [Violaceomyces palustris]